jgi:hypothetical protein
MIIAMDKGEWNKPPQYNENNKLNVYTHVCCSDSNKALNNFCKRY